jgi:hypothetical protein
LRGKSQSEINLAPLLSVFVSGFRTRLEFLALNNFFSAIEQAVDFMVVID